MNGKRRWMVLRHGMTPSKMIARMTGLPGHRRQTSLTVTLDIPTLAPTQCYELKVSLQAPDGTTFARSLHGTIHQLAHK